MNKANQSVISRLLLLVLTLSLVLSVLSGCIGSSYVADGKAEIQQKDRKSVV